MYKGNKGNYRGNSGFYNPIHELRLAKENDGKCNMEKKKDNYHDFDNAPY